MNSICAENCIMLEVEGLGFVYLSKDTFEQALLIDDRFEGQLDFVLSRLTKNINHEDAIDYFYEKAPEPLNILAPFLTLVKEEVELKNDFELLCGALHQMSTAVNFKQILLVPPEVRINLDFGWNYIRKYKNNWDSMEMKLTVSEVDIEGVKLNAIEAILKRIMPLINNVPQAVLLSGNNEQIKSLSIPDTDDRTYTPIAKPSSFANEDEKADSLFSELDNAFGDILSEMNTLDSAKEIKEKKSSVVVKPPAQMKEPEPKDMSAEEEEQASMEAIIHKLCGGFS